jgi:site-specific DNA recombinase
LLGVEADVVEDDLPMISLRASALKARRGQETKLIIADDRGRADEYRDKGLIALLLEPRDAYQLVLDNPDRTVTELARQVAKCRRRLFRLIRISMLAPDIVLACTRGMQPIQLTSARLLEVQLPVDWQEQRELLGFA